MFRWIFLVCCISTTLFPEETKISAEVDPYSNAGVPLNVTVSVVHSKKDLVDLSSFRLDKDPITLKFIKEVEFSANSDTVLSLYQLTLPAQKAGLYVLPEIHGKVGGQLYSSYPTTYAIGESSAPSPRLTPKAKQPANDRIPIILKLESIIEGERDLYPGQSVTVGYRFLFNFNVDLNKEDLPLLKGDGFEKIGAKDTKFYVKDEMNVLEVKQRLKAVKPGVYKFPAGAIQGRAYRMIGNRKETASEDSKASSTPVEFNVSAFPEERKPTSFNGAIGNDLDFKLNMLSSPEMSVGDKIVLVIEIRGKGELFEMPMPEICCQPGFSGFFAMNDLPPIEKLNEDTKTFKVEMRPLSRSIQQIPSLEFSYFNPKTKTYKTLKSTPIPIKVKPIRKEEIPEAGAPTEKSTEIQNEKFMPEPIEIGANEDLDSSDLRNHFLGSWWTLLIAPLIAGFVAIQWQWKRFLIQWRNRPKIETSRDLLEKALEYPKDTPEFFNGIEKALLCKQRETGEIYSEEIAALLREMEKRRFSPGQQLIDEGFIARVKRVFN